MDDLISRQAAIDAVRAYLSDCCVEDGDYHASGIEYDLNNLPSAQPKIIRCRDCKHWDGVDTCDVIDAPVWDNDFCSMAERRRGGAMNKDINKTLMALVPILRMNGENVTNIEAVHDWYKAGDREYMKEVAEITYDNGTVRYADIGCDSNLTAIYDVIAVIQQIKPRSKAIERIERGVYSLPSAQPERKKGKWISHKLENGVESIDKDVCSECGNRFCEIAETGCIWNYCPNCGADMRGEQE